MHVVFYISAAIAVAATLLMLRQLNAVHALIYLVISLLAVAVVFYTLGAPFAAALEVIIYAGAIMVLFVFVVMLLNLGQAAIRFERKLLGKGSWICPAVLAAILIAELTWLLIEGVGPMYPPMTIGPVEVGAALFGPYMIGVELASMLLLAGLVGAYHIGRRERSGPEPADVSEEAHK